MLGDFMRRACEAYMRQVWGAELSSLPWWRRQLVKLVRLAQNIFREVQNGHLTLWAMSLVYTTLLSMVPLLAVSFSVLKAFGVHNQLEPLLLNFLIPLGENGAELGQRIVSFVENIKVGVLGSLGLVMLIYTVVSLVQKIEDAFNYIWHVDQSRRLARRFSDYMSVILVGPVLVFSALGLTAALMGSSFIQNLTSYEPVATLVQLVSYLLPYVLVCAAFTFIYLFIPNTKVQFTAALTGGVVAGVLWESIGWLFAHFVATSTNYSAIYSSFAIIIIFMIWLYVSWLIVLLGSQIAYYQQHPELLRTRPGAGRLSNEARERLAIMLMLLIGYNYYYNRGLWTAERLAQELALSPAALQEVLRLLQKEDFVSLSGDEPPAYYPKRDIETINLRDLVEAVRRAEDVHEVAVNGRRPDRHLVDEVMHRIDESIAHALSNQTVKDLVMSWPKPKQV